MSNRLFCNLPDRGHLDRTSSKNKTHDFPKRRSDVAIACLIRRHYLRCESHVSPPICATTRSFYKPIPIRSSCRAALRSRDLQPISFLVHHPAWPYQKITVTHTKSSLTRPKISLKLRQTRKGNVQSPKYHGTRYFGPTNDISSS